MMPEIGIPDKIREVKPFGLPVGHLDNYPRSAVVLRKQRPEPHPELPP